MSTPGKVPFAAPKYVQTHSSWLNPMAMRGMVTAPHYLASQAGLSILHQGGNAVDAAIAAAMTLSVVYPHMAALGGDNFWLIYKATTRELRGLNASGRAGRRATISFYASKQFRRIPSRGYYAANTVPGSVSGWGEAYRYSKEAFDTQLGWKNLFADAIQYAENGFPVSASLAKWLRNSVKITNPELDNLQRFAGFRQTFLKPDGSPHEEGKILRQGDLVSTLVRLAEEGPEDFYQGDIARKIIADLELNDGMLSMEDFAQHRAEWVEPISVPYRDAVAFNLPPNSQGIASLSILNILNQFELAELPEGSAEHYHLIIEATKEAFRDRDSYVTDPAFLKIPVKEILSLEHGQAQATCIDPARITSRVDLNALDSKGDTAWLGVVDQAGNAVSLIQSIYQDFGSAVVPAGTGVLLHNRGSYFSLEQGHVNRLEPGKRTSHTLNPAMLFRGGVPFLVYGTMGGEGQPQTQAAMVTRIVDYRLSPRDAIEAPRWLYGRNWGAERNNVRVEARVPREVVEALQRRGHPIEIVEPYAHIMGHAGAILIDSENQILYGASDPRSDGIAVGY
jgi:gamma-glutamyltranspeptidase/glutathione hydrolase